MSDDPPAPEITLTSTQRVQTKEITQLMAILRDAEAQGLVRFNKPAAAPSTTPSAVASGSPLEAAWTRREREDEIFERMVAKMKPQENPILTFAKDFSNSRIGEQVGNVIGSVIAERLKGGQQIAVIDKQIQLEQAKQKTIAMAQGLQVSSSTGAPAGAQGDVSPQSNPSREMRLNPESEKLIIAHDNRMIKVDADNEMLRGQLAALQAKLDSLSLRTQQGDEARSGPVATVPAATKAAKRVKKRKTKPAKPAEPAEKEEDTPDKPKDGGETGAAP